MSVELRGYEQRRPEFEKVKTRILSILLNHPHGLTCGAITLQYIQRFQHTAQIDNRLRELRATGEVESFLGEGGLLVWRLNLEKWRRKQP